MPRGLSDEMKQLFKTAHCVIATASADGWPCIAPKGSMTVIDDFTLAYGELVGHQTYRNLKENPRVAVAVVDFERRAGYRLVGTASLETTGSVYERLADFFTEMRLPRPIAVVRITVEAAFDLSARSPGRRIW